MVNYKEAVKESYGKRINELSQSKESSCCSTTPVVDKNTREKQSSCCSPTAAKESNKPEVPSFGCVVNLAEKAKIKKGDFVVDLGSGAGHDLFQAADLTGPEGRVVGIDFTPDMITAGMKTAAERGITNVDFRLSDIENINVLSDNSADVIISNCVINLTMDKEAVFKEAFRILKPGGRLVDADIIAADPLPDEITQDPTAWCSCLGGALTKEGYIEKIEKAGFQDTQVTIFDEFNYLNSRFQNGILEARKPGP